MFPPRRARAMHVFPACIGIGSRDSTADACSALQYSTRIRHKGLRALHERDNPACLPVWCHGLNAPCSGCIL